MPEDENITTPEEPTENTPTLEELASQVATLSQNLTAMQDLLLEVIGEAEYELRYSGEQVENLLDSGRTVFNSKTAAQIVGIMTRLYPLYIRWGSFTLNMKVNADNGQQWSYNTRSNMIPSGVTNPAVFMVCDWNKTHFKAQSFQYKIASNGKDIDWEAYLEHTSDQGGTYAFKVYYLILGKNSGGGSIVG